MSGQRWKGRGPLGASILVALVLSLATAGQPAGSAESAPAGTGSRAVVVIDDGVQRTATCVRFPGASVSGLDALRATGASVEVASFGSKGGAVCSIQGVGCPVSGCLTCQAPAYWNYFRASPGEGSFTRSGLGASSTTVHDGDVEAWVWGAGVAGGQVPTVDSVCGIRPAPPAPPTPAPSPAPAPAPASPPAPGGGGANGSPADPGGGGGAGGAGPTTTTLAPGSGDEEPSDDDEGDEPRTCRLAGSSATTEADAPVEVCDDEDDAQAVAGERAAGEDLSATPASSTSSDGGVPWLSIVAFVALLGAVGAWAVVMRRRRQGP